MKTIDERELQKNNIKKKPRQRQKGARAAEAILRG